MHTFSEVDIGLEHVLPVTFAVASLRALSFL